MPIKYMGSKSRIAKYIVPIIQKHIDENKPTFYLEPFVGGANIIDKIQHHNKFGSDKNKYLIALLKHVQSGKPLYESVPKELYDKARTAFNNGNNLPKLVIHCGGCMLTRRAVMNRLSRCTQAEVPIVNYGVAIALMNGIETEDGSCMVKR